MTKTKPVLGRGLASLIPRPVSLTPATTVQPDDGISNEVISQIELARIQANPFQPRADFDQVALDELKRSIQEKGVIQAITVRRLTRIRAQCCCSARMASCSHLWMRRR